MPETIRIGAWDAFALLPLLENLGKNDGLSLETSPPAHTAFHLRDRLDAIGFLTPIDFAKDSSTLLIVPDVGMWSNGGSNAATVHFREGLHDIETLAVDPAYASEALLAKIIFSEEFGANPQIVPVAAGIDVMLAHADAALLVGDAALREAAYHPHALDLIESWVQMTDLPYVHGVWCAREEHLTPTIAEALRQGRRSDTTSLSKIAARAEQDHRFPGLSRDVLQDHLEGFSYDLSEDALDGMREFLRFAYYHGALPDIPEVHLFSPKGSAGNDNPLAGLAN